MSTEENQGNGGLLAATQGDGSGEQEEEEPCAGRCVSPCHSPCGPWPQSPQSLQKSLLENLESLSEDKADDQKGERVLPPTL